MKCYAGVGIPIGAGDGLDKIVFVIDPFLSITVMQEVSGSLQTNS